MTQKHPAYQEGEIACRCYRTKTGCILHEFINADGTLMRIALENPTVEDIARTYSIVDEINGKQAD